MSKFNHQDFLEKLNKEVADAKKKKVTETVLENQKKELLTHAHILKYEKELALETDTKKKQVLNHRIESLKKLTSNSPVSTEQE